MLLLPQQTLSQQKTLTMTQHLKDAFLRFYLDFEILSEAVHKIVHLHIDSGERIGRQAKHLNHWTMSSMSCTQSPSVVPVLRPALLVSDEFVELILPQRAQTGPKAA